MISFDEILERERQALMYLAKKLSYRDPDLASDLELVGCETLWAMYLSKKGAYSSKEAYYAMKNAMLLVSRKERRRKRIEKEAALSIYFGRVINKPK